MSDPMVNHYRMAQTLMELVIEDHQSIDELPSSMQMAMAQTHAVLALVDQLQHVAAWAVNNG